MHVPVSKTFPNILKQKQIPLQTRPSQPFPHGQTALSSLPRLQHPVTSAPVSHLPAADFQRLALLSPSRQAGRFPSSTTVGVTLSQRAFFSRHDELSVASRSHPARISSSRDCLPWEKKRPTTSLILKSRSVQDEAFSCGFGSLLKQRTSSLGFSGCGSSKEAGICSLPGCSVLWPLGWQCHGICHCPCSPLLGTPKPRWQGAGCCLPQLTPSLPQLLLSPCSPPKPLPGATRVGEELVAPRCAARPWHRAG